MTRLQAFILGRLAQHPHTVLDLALVLEVPTAEIRKAVEGLERVGLVEWSPDGWTRMHDQSLFAREMSELLTDEGEPPTCVEEVDRWRHWQTQNLRRLT